VKRLKDKIAIVTGGGQGIGKAAAIQFAREGAKVIIVDINRKTGEGTKTEISKIGNEVFFIQADVSKKVEVENIFQIVKRKHNVLHILYNNASVFLPTMDGKISVVEEEVWDRVISVNLKSIYLTCRYGIPLMIGSGGGSIINTASSAGVIGIPHCDAYTATKGATIALTRSLAVEYGPQKIRVNCIAPAAIATPMLHQSDLKRGEFDEARFLALRTPLRRYGEPEEIAEIATFLASDQSSYINGAIIVADGGITVNGDLSKIFGNTTDE
jgi:NAD(P)-dependent dehydrogenase (short-subunit alcohol dehydrogenase family)